MAFDEYVYGKVMRYFKGRQKMSDRVQSRTVYLETIRQRLLILSRAMTGKAIEIFPSEREGGCKNHNYFLPASCSIFPEYEQNMSFYFFRVLYLSVQTKLSLNWSHADERTDDESRKMAAATSVQVLESLFSEFEITRRLHHDLKASLMDMATEKKPADFSWLYGKWMRTQKEDAVQERLHDFSDSVRKALIAENMTTLKAKAVEEVVVVAVDTKQQEDYVLTHNFEKVDTADEFSGVWRDFDGEDELEEHMDALDELNMKYTVRIDDVAHSVYQADFTENTTVSESAEMEAAGHHVWYDEWDGKKRTYKKDFCKVYPAVQLKTDRGYYQETMSKNASVLQGLRKMLVSVNNKLQQQHRQTQGDEFEIDALTDLYADIHSGITPSENIYLSKRKKEKDIAILLLLDISLSSDGYADGNRVIDVEKQVSILFGDILHEFNIDFAVNCFYSKTRNYSTYLTLKGFDEDWNQSKHRIGAVQPKGYTRIGAALRHSGTLMATREAKNKWVILLSDGKPNDYDQYEGRYGIEDVRQALRELNQRQIHSYALAIEAQAKYYLPQMFGQSHYQILTTPSDLLNALVKLYEKIKHQS